MIKKLSKLSLQYGDDLVFNNGFIFRQPKVIDIKELGEELYFWFMMTWCREPHDMIHQLHMMGLDFNEVTKDEVFDLFVKNDTELFLFVFKYFTNVSEVYYEYFDELESNRICGKLENGEAFIIDYDTFDIISNFIKDVHFYKSQKKRKFSDTETMKKIIELELEEMRYFNKTSEDNGFSNITSSVVTGNHRTFEYVFNLSVYRLYDELYRISKRENVDKILTGIYTGNVDGKKMKQSDLNWTSNLV